jgi:GxxExxY protein
MLTKKTVNALSYKIIGYAIEIHKALGPGLLESVYETCMMHLLKQNGHKVKRQNRVKINFKGIEIETHLRYDILVDDLVVIENKAVEAFHPLHTAQTLSYMMLLQIPKGIIINYNCTNIFKEGQKTLVNKYFEQLPAGE